MMKMGITWVDAASPKPPIQASYEIGRWDKLEAPYPTSGNLSSLEVQYCVVYPERASDAKFCLAAATAHTVNSFPD